MKQLSNSLIQNLELGWCVFALLLVGDSFMASMILTIPEILSAVLGEWQTDVREAAFYYLLYDDVVSLLRHAAIAGWILVIGASTFYKRTWISPLLVPLAMAAFGLMCFEGTFIGGTRMYGRSPLSICPLLLAFLDVLAGWRDRQRKVTLHQS